MSFTKIKSDEVIWSMWPDGPRRHARHLWLFFQAAGFVAATSFCIFIGTAEEPIGLGFIALFYAFAAVTIVLGNHEGVQYFRASQGGIEVTLEQVNGFWDFWKRCEISTYRLPWEKVVRVDILKVETDGADDLFTIVECDMPLTDRSIRLPAKNLEEALKSCNRISELKRGTA